MHCHLSPLLLHTVDLTCINLLSKAMTFYLFISENPPQTPRLYVLIIKAPNLACQLKSRGSSIFLFISFGENKMVIKKGYFLHLGLRAALFLRGY